MTSVGGVFLKSRPYLHAWPHHYKRNRYCGRGAVNHAHLAKFTLTRASKNSKFIFLRYPFDSQMDNVLVDSKSNGLVYVVDRMKNHTINTLQQKIS